MKTIHEALQYRAAIKEYDTTKIIDKAQIDALLEVVRMSPSSYGLQPYEIIVIENKEIREKLKAVSYNQSQVTNASHFVVFAARKDENEKDVAEYSERIMNARGVTKESLEQYEAMMNGTLSSLSPEAKTSWAAKQAYLGLGMLLLGAAIEGVDASPMEGFDAKAYDEILSLNERGLTTVVICALGIRSDEDVYSTYPKVRKTKEEFIKTI